MRGTIAIDADVPDGCMIGWNAAGSVIVCLEYAPNHNYLIGSPDDLDDVAEWTVNMEHARRIAMIGAWRAMEYECAGSA